MRKEIKKKLGKKKRDNSIEAYAVRIPPNCVCQCTSCTGAVQLITRNNNLNALHMTGGF